MRSHTPMSWPIMMASAALGILTLGGCGDSDELPREPVSGTVTLDGKPLASGLITFQPGGGDVATQGGGAIESGKYAIPRDQGLVPGNYRVSVTNASGPSAPQADALVPGDPLPPPKEAIPAIYNSQTT